MIRSVAAVVALACSSALSPDLVAQQCPLGILDSVVSPQPFLNGRFGASVALSQTSAMIGAPTGDGATVGSGVVFAYDLVNDSLEPNGSLSVGTTGDYFGHSVAMDGDFAVIGAPYATNGGFTKAGVAHVFERVAGAWTLVQSLSGTMGTDRLFGHSVSIAGDRIGVGAPGENTLTPGEVHVFQRSVTGQWNLANVLTAAVSTPGNQFGYSVDLRPNRIAIGAPKSLEVGVEGAVFIFDFFAGNWFQTTKLASYGSGSVVSTDGDWLAMNSGSTSWVIYKRNGATWSLYGTPTSAFGTYGESISLRGDKLATGRRVFSSWNTGIGGVFELFENNWVQISAFGPIDNLSLEAPAPGWLVSPGWFGASVAVTDGRVIFGGPHSQVFVFLGQQVFEWAGAAIYSRFSTGPIKSYGPSCSGSGGFSPTLSANGCAVGGGSLTVDINGGVGGSIAVFLFGLNPAAIPVGAGCLLQVAPTLPPTPIVPLFGVGPGQGAISFAAGLPTSIPSISFTMQAFCADPSAPLGFSATNGVHVSLN
jgi:hypothetical protein